MAFIPAGIFTMGNLIISGSTFTNDLNITDANPTNVAVSAFYMDTTLVTSNQWRSVYAYATNHGYGFIHPGLGKASNHPVETVDWYDCVKWSNARSQQTGLNGIGIGMRRRRIRQVALIWEVVIHTDQSAPSLNGVWSDVTVTINQVNNQNQLILTAPAGTQFFRLAL
jgi:formylglycine-generating enzyme required for sulfatase activity